ncbi:MAG: potassium:proton antiporter [Bacillaceae bacterium]|jgi:Putative regulatory, ligand-binding protein related to C-terminal domains of K+ channels|uniref:Potassium:proton antiporter n=2 Tax=Aeribacillus TaxID=1055323 RepID=A0A161WX47_9BACI|nr:MULTISPECIES: cation:proton antiporter regulatory subunit [Aeribacillus]AXI38353.1 potassium:proton antiporter [Bacillaceae bacterium ZC4]REJ17752.1 MAG: potassium:proton antiporter [Bacillaceae bacterium]ASS89070.1 potassium:proton antiporter [Aeribacillus pallidus]KZM54549.1 potassium:proton antiporter [Aeribacillus pallidus]MDR9793003.1 cation:proton antiporter regulatory subunit [Aeribacillus pallidus]
MNIRESELPGIGYKFEIITKNQDKLVIVIHDDGRREIYHFDSDDHDEVLSTATFDDSEARQIAGILGGMAYKPKALETVDFAFDDLIIEWYQVEPGAPVVNKTIGEIDIRNNYGVTVIAIKKKKTKKTHNPGPDTVIEAGDTLVISGERNQLKQLVNNLLSNKGKE